MFFSGIALISGILLLRAWFVLKRQKKDEKPTRFNYDKPRINAFQKLARFFISSNFSKVSISHSKEKPSPESSAAGKEGETTASPQKTQELDRIIHRRANSGMNMTLERQRLSEQWDVEMLTLARKVKAEIDTKIVALQWMIADANQVMAEMEQKISSTTKNSPMPSAFAPESLPVSDVKTTPNSWNEPTHRLTPHIHADSVAVDLNDIRNPNREYSNRLEIPEAGYGSPATQGGCARPKATVHTDYGISNTTSDIENIQNMTVPDPFADADFGLTKAIQELDRISSKIPPFELMQALGRHENQQVYENHHTCRVPESTFSPQDEMFTGLPAAGSSVGSSSLQLPPLPVMTQPSMTRISPVPASCPIAPPLNTPLNVSSSQYGAIPIADKDMDGYATTIRFPGSEFHDDGVGAVTPKQHFADHTPTDQGHDRDMIIRGLFPKRRMINISHVGGPKLPPSSKILAQPAPKFESLTVADKENVKRMGSISTRPSHEEKPDKNNNVNLTADIPQNGKPNAKQFLVESEPHVRREIPELGVRTAKRHQVFYLSEQGISSREIAARIEMPIGEVELILSLYKRISDDRQKKQQFPNKKITKSNEPMKLTGRVIGGRKTGRPEKRSENNADHEKGSQ